MSLDPDPKTRIPSNFWIESAPVVDLGLSEIPAVKELGRIKAWELLVEKYRARKIKSVIHFRRIMDAYYWSEDSPAERKRVLKRLEQYFFQPDLETRAAFDEFFVERKRTQQALEQCEDFVARLKKLRLKFTSDDDERKSLREALRDVVAYCTALEQNLSGSDDPDIPKD